MGIRNYEFSTKVKIGILVAVSVILMYFRIGIPIFPSFLDFDLSDIPVLFIAMYFSPILGVGAMAIKNILIILTMGSFTYGIGEFANFLIGSSFIFVASKVFFKLKGRTRCLISYLLGTFTLVVVGVLSNYFLILPVYLKVLGLNLSSIVGEGGTVLKYLIFSIIPYNIVKSIIIFIPTVVIFYRVKKNKF